MTTEKGGFKKKKKPEIDFGYSAPKKEDEVVQATQPVVEPAPVVEQTKIIIEPPKTTKNYASVNQTAQKA